MWEPRPLTPLWVFTACYRDSFTFTFTRFPFRVTFYDSQGYGAGILTRLHAVPSHPSPQFVFQSSAQHAYQNTRQFSLQLSIGPYNNHHSLINFTCFLVLWAQKLNQDRPVLLCILKWINHIKCLLVAPRFHYWQVHWKPSR
jgi:hypothetical protein